MFWKCWARRLAQDRRADSVLNIDPKRTRRIFEKLLRVAPELEGMREHAVSKDSGLMDLNLDVLERSGRFMRIALSHYWRHPSGDMTAEPDMKIAVFFDYRLAEALIYRDTFLYEVAYPEVNKPPDLAAHGRLNAFLEQWLDNLAAQEHVLGRGR